jgi:hemerythrin-like metal-binding protein
VYLNAFRYTQAQKKGKNVEIFNEQVVHTKQQASEFNWDDSMLVGHEAIDETHREFVTLAATLINCSDISAVQSLIDIELHILLHFDNEKAMMERTEFPAMDCHIDEHNKVIQAVQQVRELYSNGKVKLNDVKRLAKALIDWFPGHVIYMDSALSTWFSKKSYNGAPVVFRRSITNHLSEK